MANQAGLTFPYFIVQRHIKSIVRYTWRESGRSLTGKVCVCVFSNRVAAQTFARYWAALLPEVCKGVVVRRNGREYAASVPCVLCGANSV